MYSLAKLQKTEDLLLRIQQIRAPATVPKIREKKDIFTVIPSPFKMLNQASSLMSILYNDSKGNTPF